MTDPRPRLLITAAPRQPRGAVLALHGGQEDSQAAVHRTQLAVLRLIPVARAVAKRGDRQVAVVRLLYRYRGWNDAPHPALDDARWALAECRDRFGADAPISIIGHSMGGRIALRLAGEPNVRGVVGMAPWLPEHEPRADVAGRRLLLLHGTADRTTDPAGSAAFVADAEATAKSVSLLRLPGEGHPLLRHRALVDGLAAAFALHALDETDSRPGRTEEAQISNLLQKTLTGEVHLSL
ncbi:MAG: alpha/beta hydrolase [Jatrophihabitans sp.]